MKKIEHDIVHFLEDHGAVVVSTIDESGFPHSSCKGIVKIDEAGRIYLLDLYQARTYNNLKSNPHISITAVDEHKFRGYSLKGMAEIISLDALNPKVFEAWEDRIAGRLTSRLLKNIKEEKGHPHHPEALLPKPKYLIMMDVSEILDLTPYNLK